MFGMGTKDLPDMNKIRALSDKRQCNHVNVIGYTPLQDVFCSVYSNSLLCTVLVFHWQQWYSFIVHCSVHEHDEYELMTIMKVVNTKSSSEM